MGDDAGMTSASIARPLLLLSAVALVSLSCVSAAVEPPAAAASAPPSAGLLAHITTLIGDAECDHPSQCHVVGIGSKPCGGPSGYLAWSEKKTDPNALRTAVQAHALAQRDEDKAAGLLSNCMVTPMPAAVCRVRADSKKVCQLGQGGASSAI